MKILKKIALAAVTSTLFVSPVLAASTIQMMTGSAKGSYNTVICPAIANHKAVINEGITVDCVPSNGSGANFDAVLENGATTVGLSQLDVYARKLIAAIAIDEDAEEAMGNIGFIAPEALFCAASKRGRIPEGPGGWNILADEEPADKQFVISTYAEDSGSAGTIDFIRGEVSEFGASSKMKYKPKLKFEAEMGRLTSGKRDMTCFVSFANPKDKKIAGIEGSDDHFFVEFSAPVLKTLKIGEMPAYQVSEVPLTGSVFNLIGGGAKVKTLTTGITLVMNVDEIDTPVYDALVSAVTDPELLPADGIVGSLARQARAKMGAAMKVYENVTKK